MCIRTTPLGMRTGWHAVFAALATLAQSGMARVRQRAYDPGGAAVKGGWQCGTVIWANGL